MAREYMTIVYAIDDQEAWKKEWQEHIQPIFLKRALPISIVAASISDEISRLDLIRHEMEKPDNFMRDRTEAIQEILDARDLEPLLKRMEVLEE